METGSDDGRFRLSLYRGFPKWILFHLTGSQHSSVQEMTSSKTLRGGVWLQNNDPKICLQFGSRLHFKRANLCRAKKKPKKRKKGVPKKGVQKKGKWVSFGKG